MQEDKKTKLHGFKANKYISSENIVNKLNWSYILHYIIMLQI